VLIGDFTARIGDPTDKESVRTALSGTQVAEHMRTYKEQIDRIFGGQTYEIRYNSEWLERMDMEQILRLASHVTVQQMIAREMFQERLKKEKPIFLHEFVYPLLQGYDSVAMQIDGEVGGNDQVFNMLVGRDLERELIQKDKLVFATRLLVDAASGKKMSKTEGVLIAVTDEPAEIRRKILALDDATIATMFELCTEKDLGWIEENKPAMKENPRQFKEELADVLIAMYHGAEKTGEARQELEVSVSEDMSLDEFVKNAASLKSMAEAKRLIEQKGVTVNGEPVTDWRYAVKKRDSIKVGKGKFYKAK
jgi:tyrosyl-tRNA synthetase